jgi:hypothetical protein
MNFDPTETLYLTEEDWDGAFPETWTAQSKGVAIDSHVKRLFGGAGARFDPYDMKWKIAGCVYHEVKSTTRKWVGISPLEKEHADHALEHGDDTLIWVFEQLEARDEFRFFAIAKYSRIRNFIFPSNYDRSWVKRGEQWVEEPTPSFNKYVAREHGEPTL